MRAEEMRDHRGGRHSRRRAFKGGGAREDLFVICADGGYRHAARSGIVPDVVLGDFDSLDMETCGLPAGVEIVALPVEKDDTDTFYAAKYALERGFSELELYGCVGSRTDHTLAPLSPLVMLWERGARGKIVGDTGTIEVISGMTDIAGRRAKPFP